MSPFTYSVVKFQQDFHAWRPHRQFGMRRSNKSYRLTSESCAHSRDFWRLYPVEEVPHPYPQGVFQRLVSHQHDRCQSTPDHWEKRFGSCSWRRRWPSSAGFSADFFGMSYCSPPHHEHKPGESLPTFKRNLVFQLSTPLFGRVYLNRDDIRMDSK